MSKVTIVGAGNVGATGANVMAFKEVADEIVLLDIKEGISEGKSLDMMQTATLLGFDSRITGVTNDYSATAGSDVVVITSGIPRKPGMTREELIGVNAGIVKGVAKSILDYSPNAIISTRELMRVGREPDRFGGAWALSKGRDDCGLHKAEHGRLAA